LVDNDMELWPEARRIPMTTSRNIVMNKKADLGPRVAYSGVLKLGQWRDPERVCLGP